jgi:hypothetical protein
MFHIDANRGWGDNGGRLLGSKGRSRLMPVASRASSRLAYALSFTVALVVAAAVADAQAGYSVLYNFGSNSGDPVKPSFMGIIAQGRDGNLYTTSQSVGSPGFSGCVFKITPTGALAVLYKFDGSKGNDP